MIVFYVYYSSLIYISCVMFLSLCVLLFYSVCMDDVCSRLNVVIMITKVGSTSIIVKYNFKHKREHRTKGQPGRLKQ